MRLKLPLFVLGLAAFASAPAMAQNNASTTPYYNTTSTTPTYYATTPTGAVPVYNNLNTTPIMPMDQMVAGKNAPSYNYNNPTGVQPYNFGTGAGNVSGQAAMSAEQQAQMYQQQLLNQQQQQQYANGQTGPMGVSTTQGSLQNLTQFANSPFGTNTQGTAAAVPKQRKVIYKELNNPLKEPARLFNPDQ